MVDSHEEIVISKGGNDFPFWVNSGVTGDQNPRITNLDNLLAKNTIVKQTLFDGLNNVVAGVPDPYFQSRNLTTQRLPVTWDEFSTSYFEFNNAFGVPSRNNDLFNLFVATYKQILGMTADANTAPDGDWAALAAFANNAFITNPTLDNPTTTDVNEKFEQTPNIDADQIKEQFVRAFNTFLAHYPYKSDGKVGTATDFLTNWVEFAAVTVRLTNANAATVGELGNVTVPTYESVYLAFGFPAADFDKRLYEFYKKVLKETGDQRLGRGYFDPSHVFDEWIEAMRQEHFDAVVKSAVGSPQTRRVLVIDRVLRLLIEMIDILQKISATQAERLTFLTRWQEAYTNLLVDIPIFTIGDGSALDESIDDAGKKKEEAKFRTTVNQKMQALQEKTRARRSQISDAAKAMQSVINQSQDSANQQTDIATAILQQLSTILSAIFR